MTPEFEFDVFLSHSSKDKPIVRALAERMRQDGLRVWLDEWEIQLGDSVPTMLEYGLEHSRMLILCMSAHAFDSDWAQLESQTFRFRDPLNRERRFIPVKLDDAPIKGSLAQFLCLDWRTQSAENYQRLMAACQRGGRGTAPGPAQDITGLVPLDLPLLAKNWPNQGDALELSFVNSAGLPTFMASVKEEYCIRVTLRKSGYLLLFAQGASGKLFQLLPNTITPECRLEPGHWFCPGELLPLPAKELGPYDHLYFGGVGNEWVIGFLLAQPLATVRPRKLGDGFEPAELQAILRALHAKADVFMAHCSAIVTAPLPDFRKML